MGEKIIVTISAKINQKEFEGVGRILWQPHYRLNKFNNYIFHRLGMLSLMGCVLAVTLLSTYLTERFRGWGAFAGIAVGLAVVFALFRHMMSANPKLLAKVNESLPDYIDLSENAIIQCTEDGRANTHPWTLAPKWGRADEVIVIEFTQSEYCVLPLSSLSASDRQTVLELVRAKLGEPKFQI